LTEKNLETPILRDKDGNHKDYGNIIYCDGRVGTVNGKTWKDKLESDKKEVNK
jgi:prepilin-type processing-associated H-X9-DG protein